MIIDVLNKKILEMKSLRHLEMLRDHRTQQEATDNRYRILVAQAQVFSKALRYASDNFNFVLSDSLQSNVSDLFVSLKAITQSGFADKDGVVAAENNIKTIQSGIKKEWGKHYSIYTASTVNTLKVISGIELDKVEACILDIKAAENWSGDIEVLTKLRAAMSSAEALIKSLNMDQETIGFLAQMTAGKATLLDLNEKVLTWIKRESLEGKIRLSFINK